MSARLARRWCALAAAVALLSMSGCAAESDISGEARRSLVPSWAPASSLPAASSRPAYVEPRHPEWAAVKKQFASRVLRPGPALYLPAAAPATFYATYDGGVAELRSDTGVLVRMLHQPDSGCHDAFTFVTPDTILVAAIPVQGPGPDAGCSRYTRVNVDTGKSSPGNAAVPFSFSTSARWGAQVTVGQDGDAVAITHDDDVRTLPAPAGSRLMDAQVNNAGVLAVTMTSKDFSDPVLLVVPAGSQLSAGVVLGPVASSGRCSLWAPHWVDGLVPGERQGSPLLAVWETCDGGGLRIIDAERAELRWQRKHSASSAKLTVLTGAGEHELTGWRKGAANCTFEGFRDVVCPPMVAWRPYAG